VFIGEYSAGGSELEYRMKKSFSKVTGLFLSVAGILLISLLSMCSFTQFTDDQKFDSLEISGILLIFLPLITVGCILIALGRFFTKEKEEIDYEDDTINSKFYDIYSQFLSLIISLNIVYHIVIHLLKYEDAISFILIRL